MYFVESMVFNIILILFPLLVYLIYLAYSNNKQISSLQGLFFEIAVFSSLYLIMRYGIVEKAGFSVMLYNIPLLISYVKGRKFMPLLLSCILIWYYVDVMQFNFFFILCEYLIYYCIYVYLTHKKTTKYYIINSFVLIKSAILAFEIFSFVNPYASFMDNFLHVLAVTLTFYVMTFIIFYLLEKGEEIMNLNSTMKQLEKEKLLRASLFKITHEIKNPIAVCKGYLDMLDINNEEKIKKYIPIVKQEIARTLILMDDYLDYTKIKIAKEEVDLYLLLEETYQSLGALFKQHKIKVDVKIPDDELYIDLDYNRIKQVLINLFKNAMEAKKDDDQEMIIKLRVKKLKTKVVITIEDNGRGMDDETLDQVDKMFFTTKQKGSGLGVSLSKEIIELHNGTLQYESYLGKGTKAIIKLPLTTN